MIAKNSKCHIFRILKIQNLLSKLCYLKGFWTQIGGLWHCVVHNKTFGYWTTDKKNSTIFTFWGMMLRIFKAEISCWETLLSFAADELNSPGNSLLCSKKLSFALRQATHQYCMCSRKKFEQFAPIFRRAVISDRFSIK